MAVSLSDSPPSQGPCCPVCFRDYSDSEGNLIPRILQCGHTYCSECLDKLLNMEPDEDEYQQVVLNIRYAGREWTTTRNYPRSPYSTNELKCPTCKTTNHVQNRDISSLTKNFALLGCRLEVSGTPQRNRHFCKDHNHEKRIYCNDCKTLICAYCQLYGGHRGHEYIVATEASIPSVESLKAVDKTLSEDLVNLTTGEGALNNTISRLSKTRSKCEKNVKSYFGTAITKLTTQRDSLLSQISSWTDEQMYILKAQLDMLTSSTKELKTIQSDCQSLIAGDPLDALTQQQSLEADVGRLRERLGDLSLQPLIKPWMRAKEEGSCDAAVESLVDNFKLSYEADSAGMDRDGEGGGADDQSGNESESSVDSLMGESGGLSDVLEVYRLQSLESRRALNISSEDTGEPVENQVYSQETQAMASNFEPVELRRQRSERAPGHDLNWLTNPPSSNFSLFNRHLIHGRSSLNQVMDDSESNSEPDNPTRIGVPGYMGYHSSRLRRGRNTSRDSDNDSGSIEVRSDDSDHEIEEILERHQSRSHMLGMGGAGVESVLDSLEIRRHWGFLNGSGGRMRGRVMVGEQAAEEEDSSKEDEEEEEPHALGLLPMLPMYSEGRSAHSDSSPSPPPGLPGNLTDFAFPHHLSLPVDSGRDPDDEVVFPSTPHYSWANQREGRGRSLQVNMGGSRVVQLSIQPNTSEEGRASDSEPEAGMDLASEQ